MGFRTVLVALSILSTAGLCAESRGYRWVDLTYAFNNDTVLVPGRKLVISVETEGFLPSGQWLASRGICTPEHAGTHIDAPYHVQKQGQTLSEIPLESLLDIPGVCVDVYDKVNTFNNGRLRVNSNYAVTRQDLLDWEAKNGQIPPRSVVLFRTGWGSRWSDAAAYLGIVPEKRNSTNLNFVGDPSKPYQYKLDSNLDTIVNYPGLDSSAAKFLSTERNVYGAGIDTPSVVPGNSSAFDTLNIFAKSNVYLIENIANLHLLPPRGFQLFVAPFKLDKGTGSPTRLIAKLQSN